MKPLSTTISYTAERVAGTTVLTVTRLADGATKTFKHAMATPEQLIEFMHGITDEQAANYFGKFKKTA